VYFACHCFLLRYPLVVTMKSDFIWMRTDAASRKILAEQLSDSMFDILEYCQLKIERTAETLKLTLSEFKLVRLMKDHRMLRAGELAQRMRVTCSRLTRILDVLGKKGIARREVSPGDRRVIEVTLTPEGQEVQADLMVACLQARGDIVVLLPAEARESALLGMAKLGSQGVEQALSFRQACVFNPSTGQWLRLWICLSTNGTMTSSN